MFDDPNSVGALTVALPSILAIWLFFRGAHWGVRAIGYAGLFITLGYLRSTGGLVEIGTLVMELSGASAGAGPAGSAVQ
ncbi:MAG: hypothetical protein AAGF32_01325 [Pseudomonadota bacterium]